MNSVPPLFPYGDLSANDLHKVQWFYGKYVEEYSKDYTFGHFLLAAYAAVPTYLTPDLLYQVWQNFNKYKWGGESQTIHRVSVSDVLLSSLCSEIGFELYEMHYDIRMAMLKWLKLCHEDPIWKKRELPAIDELAAFVEKYHEIPNSAGQRWGAHYTEVQSLEARSYSRPGEVAQVLFGKMMKSAEKKDNNAELLRVMDMFVKTKNRLGVLEGEESPAFSIFEKQAGLMEAWKSYIQKNNDKFVELLYANRNSLDLLTHNNNGGIELKVAGGAAELLDQVAERKIYGLIIGIRDPRSGDDPIFSKEELAANSIEGALRKIYPGNELITTNLSKRNATKSSILEQFRKLIADGKETDDIICYLAAPSVSGDNHCLLRCYDPGSKGTDPSSLLRDEEIELLSREAKCNSFTLIVQADHAGTPYWIDQNNPRNILIASCAYGQTAADKKTARGIQSPLFTSCLADSIAENGTKATNRKLFGDAMQQFSKLEFEKTWQINTPLMICSRDTYDFPFMKGRNLTLTLQNLLRKTGYMIEPDTGTWNKATAAAMSAYCKKNDVPVNLQKQDYIDRLNDLLRSKKEFPIFLLIFSDPDQKLTSLGRERSTIIEMLAPLKSQVEVIVLDTPGYMELSTVITDPKNRNRIGLVYYSGKDREGQIQLKDGSFNFSDCAQFPLYQEDIKLFIANTCWSERLASYMVQIGVANAIGISATVPDESAAEFGIAVFKKITERSDVLNEEFLQSFSSNTFQYQIHRASWTTGKDGLVWDLQKTPVDVYPTIYSLSVGISNYNRPTQLDTAVLNARMFSSWAEKQTDPANCHLLKGEDAYYISKSEIYDSLAKIREIADADPINKKLFIIYISGYGLEMNNNPVLLIPGIDTRVEDNFDLSSVLTLFTANSSVNKILVLYDLIRTDTARLQSNFESNVNSSQSPNAGMLMGVINRDFSRTEQPIKPVALDNSEFTKVLLKGLNGAAADGAGNITTTSLRNFLSERSLRVKQTLSATNTDFIISKATNLTLTKVKIKVSEDHIGNTFELLDNKLNQLRYINLNVTTIECDLEPGSYVARIRATNQEKAFVVADADMEIEFSPMWKFKDKWVCILGSQVEKSDTALVAAAALGRFLADQGYGLLTGGWPGVDQSAAESFFDTMHHYDRERANDYLLQYIEPGSKVEFDKGKIEEVSLNQWQEKVARKCFAVISVGGNGFTYEFFMKVRHSIYPFIPLPFTGGDSERIFQQLRTEENVLIVTALPRLAEVKAVDENCLNIIRDIFNLELPPVTEKDFRADVERFYKERPITVPDDLQKNRWGGKAENNGRALRATVEKLGFMNFKIKAFVESPGLAKSNRSQQIAFFLHNTFSEEVVYTTMVDSEAVLEFNAYEAFTIGAYLEYGTELELDLNEQPGYPEDFYYQDVSETFKDNVAKFYESKPVTVKDDLQKGRWGGLDSNGGLKLSAKVLPGMFGFFKIELSVETTTTTPYMGDVAFLVHDTFTSQIIYKKSTTGIARISLTAYEAFTAGAYAKDGTLLELDLQLVEGLPEGFYYKEDSPPPFKFLTEQEILNLVFEQSKSAKSSLKLISKNLKAIQIFKNATQQTWLVFSDEKMFIVLDDKTTREKNYQVQVSMNKKRILPLIPGRNETLFSFSFDKSEWAFSPNLFPNLESLSKAIGDIIALPNAEKSENQLKKPKTKLKIFICYAHEDEAMKKELDKSLIMLKRSDKIEVWQDRQLMAGQEWDAAILKELNEADIILLLISVDFNNSQYIWEKGLAIAMERRERDEVRVIPIILRNCEWSEMPYAKLQALPTGAKPISMFTDRDEAYTDIAKGIRTVVDYMLVKQQKSEDQFVDGLKLEGPKGKFKVDKSAKSLIRAGEYQAFLCDKTIISFTPEVSGTIREDVLCATLLGQLAANKKFSPETEIVGWYKELIDVLSNVGWTIEENDMRVFNSQKKLADVVDVIRDILTNAFGLDYMPYINKTLDSYKEMTDASSGKIVVFEKNIRSFNTGHFQIALATEENGEVHLRLGTFLLNTSSETKKILFLKFEQGKTQLEYSSTKATLDRKLYEAVRQTVKDKLGNNFEKYITEIDALDAPPVETFA